MAEVDNAVEADLIETARRVLPAGGFGNVTHEVVVARGLAGHVWDVDDKEFIDYLLGSGPMLVGHAHPEVLAVTQEKVAMGTTFFANNEDGIRLAADIVEAVPCAEQVRFVSTGSEADAYAMRLARAHTGRDKILKFEGGYHGMSDYALMSLAPKRGANFPRPLADSAGIPRSIRDEMVVAPYNDLESVASLVRQYKGEIAAIIVEPLQRVIPARAGFLAGLRKITRDNDIVLIFDEVVTGFRFAYGGAQAYYGVTPDICTLGKAIGGGFPLAAIAGRGDIMAHFDRGKVGEEDFVLQIGTLSGNPVAAAAGRKTLEVLRRAGSYERIFRTGKALMEGFGETLAVEGVTAKISGAAPMFEVIFTDRDVVDYRTSLGDPAKTAFYNTEMRNRGILKSESKYYISLAHTDQDIEDTLKAFGETIKSMKRQGVA